MNKIQIKYTFYVLKYVYYLYFNHFKKDETPLAFSILGRRGGSATRVAASPAHVPLRKKVTPRRASIPRLLFSNATIACCTVRLPDHSLGPCPFAPWPGGENVDYYDRVRDA